MKQILFWIIFIGIILGTAYLTFFYEAPQEEIPEITTFDECVEAGNPVMESYPRQCRSGDDRLFVEQIDEPIFLPEEREPGAHDGCMITGCSSHICADQEMVTTCEYREEYECYASAICERNAGGECGWREDQKLLQCLIQLE